MKQFTASGELTNLYAIPCLASVRVMGTVQTLDIAAPRFIFHEEAKGGGKRERGGGRAD